MPEAATVLLVEDEHLWSELLLSKLSEDPSVQIVGSARDGETALKLARQLQPAAVLMDIELEGEMDGIETALAIKKGRPETGIVILSAHNDRRYVTSLPLDEQPGWAYLLKQNTRDVAAIVRAIYASINGMLMLDSEVIANLRPKTSSVLTRLTPRLLEVLQFIAEGHNNATIAAKMNLAEKSVETYINSLYQELGVSGEPGVHPRVKATRLFLEQSESRH